jgi:hypothetical protein
VQVEAIGGMHALVDWPEALDLNVGWKLHRSMMLHTIKAVTSAWCWPSSGMEQCPVNLHMLAAHRAI